MMWFTRNAIARKNLMALTGLFVSFFLIIHLAGNLQLLLPETEARLQYNAYSQLLSGNLFVKLVSYLLYASLLLHTIDGLYLLIISKKAKGTSYSMDRRARASTWQSRNMMALGVILLVFLVIHFKDFWYSYKFGDLPLDEKGQKDVYSLVVAAFQELWYVILYIISIAALGLHLLHGVYNAHRTLGLYHPFYTRLIKILGTVFALLMTIGYIIIPVSIYLKHSL